MNGVSSLAGPSVLSLCVALSSCGSEAPEGAPAGGTMATDGASQTGGTAGSSANTSAATSTAESTAGTTSGATAAESASAGSSGGGEDGVTYAAVYIPGSPNQLQIRRKDEPNDRCTWIVLTDQSVGILAIATPAGWTPQVGLTNDNPGSCDMPDPLVGGSQEASNGMGSIVGDDADADVPCTLDVQVELTFTSLDLVQTFTVDALTVDGC